MEMQSQEKGFWNYFLEKYNSFVKSNYKNNSILNINLSDGDILGLNSYSFFLVVDLLEKERLKTSPLGEILADKDRLKGIGVELGLVLGPERYANEYLVKKLTKQAKERKYEFSCDAPLVFKPYDLEIILDKKAPEGLGFKIKESAAPFNAPELGPLNNRKRFNIVNEKELPVFDENGSRTLYTRKGGLLRFCLSKYGDLCSLENNLVRADSDYKLLVRKY